MILETKRLMLREMTQADFPELCKMLLDDKVMYAYEGAFTKEEAQGWMDRQLKRYEEYGFGLWAVVLKESGQMIGQCGITMQQVKERTVMEVGYLFQKEHWHHGYASEAAIACKEYAFDTLNATEIYSIIRDTNQASQNVAIRNGMTCVECFTKHYRGIDVPHVLFAVQNEK